jgi:hypothetical protein
MTMIMTRYGMCADFSMQERVSKLSEDFTSRKDEVGRQ